MPMLKKPQRKLSKKEQSLARLENFRQEVTTDSHTIPIEELCLRLETDPVTGLTQEQAVQILANTGPNALTPSRKKSEIIKFLETLFHGFSLLLWVGSLLCFINALVSYYVKHKTETEQIVLGITLILVVVLTGAFMYYQERKSHEIMASFANMVPPKATVIRGGQTITIQSRDVVIGDLVEIKFGDRVPADLRIIQCQTLKVDNSPITGESEAQSRSTDSNEENLLEAKNIVFFSTNILEGTGRGIVIACGDATVMGRIAGLTARLEPNKTPMARELARFMKIVSVWACALGVVLGSINLALGHEFMDTVLFMIGMIVANVPEGLLATVIVCLTVTAKRMAARNCLIKKLDAVETLGSTSTICSDKTGTLTQNRMTVCHVWVNGTVIEADKVNKNNMKNDAFSNLMRCAALCNRAEFVADQEKIPVMQRKIRGDASEAAILKFIESSQFYPPEYRNLNPKLIEIPFSSATKFQISVHGLQNGSCMVMMKGAPEVILERCSSIYYQNSTQDMNPQLLNMCNKACTNFAEMGERVLGFCDLILEDKYNKNYNFSVEPANFPLRGLRFLGLLAMIDPPRPQVPDAIRKCKTAGIKVVMVTGDHPITAKAIASQVGIITEKNIIEFKDIQAVRKIDSTSTAAVVVHGSLLRYLLQEELDNILANHQEIVFARTSPTQKLQIVEGYQRLGEIVAVTGDGVNDAPALKKADIGIAMGITGTEVSQQAADIILLDDNFASIITGVEEGRRIFDNLKKSIVYTLTSNVPEIIPFLVYTFMNIPLPLGTIGILCIDLVTDMMPAISLAYEKAERDIMSRPPRNPLRDKLVTRKLYFLAYGNLGFIEASAAMYIYYIVMAEHGWQPRDLIGIRHKWEDRNETVEDSYGRTWNYGRRKVLEWTCYTAVFISVVMCQWFNVIACKTRINSIIVQGMGNVVLNVGIFVETVFACLLAYCPYTYYLDFYPISWRIWLYGLPFAVILLLFDEFRKWHIRKYPKGWYQRETSY